MTANEVDRALAAPIDQVGALLLAIQEDQWFDRKSIRTKAKDLGPALVALANAEGGVLVVGIHNGTVEGLKQHAHVLNELKQAAIDFSVPPVRASVDQVGCVNSLGELDAIVVIRVDPSERVHETPNGDCYLRIGDESRKLRHDQRQELEFDKGQSQYDGMPIAGVTASDLSQEKLLAYRRATGANQVGRLLRARSLTTRDDRVTNACFLLFAEHPQELFPEAHVRVLKYDALLRGTGSRLAIQDEHDYRIEGAIPDVIENAAAIVEELIPKRRALRGSGRFESESIVPRDAWLEGLVNAVIHRSYSLAGDHVRVEIYPDRIEIESPGRFPGLANPTRPLDISRYARNPRIARVCADLRIGQELGEGIRRIFEEMRRSGLTDPVYTQGQGSVRLRLQAIERLDQRVLDRLPPRAEEVLGVLRSAGQSLGTGEIAELVGLSRPATKQRLDALLSERMIVWRGKSPKDPRAVWSLPNN